MPAIPVLHAPPASGTAEPRQNSAQDGAAHWQEWQAWQATCLALTDAARQALAAAQAGHWDDFIAQGQRYANLGARLRPSAALATLPAALQAECQRQLQEALALEQAARQLSQQELNQRQTAIHHTRQSQRLHRSYGALQAEFK